MSNQIREQGYVIKHKDSESYYGMNMLEDYTLGEPINCATIFEDEDSAHNILAQLGLTANADNYEVRKIERRVMWRII